MIAIAAMAERAIYCTLPLPSKDHRMDSDKQGHGQTLEPLCGNIVHTEKRGLHLSQMNIYVLQYYIMITGILEK